MRIQHNIMAMSAYRNYTNNVSAMKKNLEKLSSGYKINRAGDDAAGLAISEKMRAQITGLETAQKNAKDGISLVQTAEGALTEVHDMLNRMVELATQSANGTYDNDVDRFQLQKEMNQLRSEINRIADSSNFNGIQLLDGSMSTEGSTIATGVLEAGSAATTDETPVTGVLTWANTATASATWSQVPSTTLTHLKADGGSGAIGSFTVDFGGLKVTSASGTKADITVTIGNTATFDYEASANGGVITASKVAADLANKFFVIEKDGTQKIVTGTTALATDDLVYKATKNADNNSVTFTAVAVAAKATTAAKVTAADATKGTAAKLTSGADLPDSIVASKQLVDLNFDVAVATKTANKADSKEGFQQVGVTKYTNTEAAGKQQFAQAVVAIDPTKITDGMVISVNGVDKTIRLSGDVGEGEIDLTKVAQKTTSASGVDTYSLTNNEKGALAQAIANAYAQEDLGGLEVGVDGSNNLVIAEKVNADRTSAVTDESLAKALSSYASFKELVGFKTVTENDDAQDGTVTMELDVNKLTKGTTLTITDPTGAAATYALTSNVNDLVSALGSAAALSSDGKTITLTYTVDPAMTEAQNQAAAKVEGHGLTLQIGDTAADYNKLKVDINDCHTWALGIDKISIGTQDDAADAVDAIKKAINYVSDVRGTLGATQNRLDHTINNLSVMTENIQDAESTIRDVDVAEEMMAYTKNNILIQSAQAMLAQANQVPQGVLQLLQ